MNLCRNSPTLQRLVDILCVGFLIGSLLLVCVLALIASVCRWHWLENRLGRWLD